MIGYPAETGIPRKHSAQVEYHHHSSHPHHAEPAPALLHWKRQVRRKPREQSPPCEHPKKIEQQKRKRMPCVRRPKNNREFCGDGTWYVFSGCPTSRFLCEKWGFSVILIARFILRRHPLPPHLRLGHTPLNPQRNHRRQNPHKEHRSPPVIPRHRPRPHR